MLHQERTFGYVYRHHVRQLQQKQRLDQLRRALILKCVLSVPSYCQSYGSYGMCGGQLTPIISILTRSSRHRLQVRNRLILPSILCRIT